MLNEDVSEDHQWRRHRLPWWQRTANRERWSEIALELERDQVEAMRRNEKRRGWKPYADHDQQSRDKSRWTPNMSTVATEAAVAASFVWEDEPCSDVDSYDSIKDLIYQDSFLPSRKMTYVIETERRVGPLFRATMKRTTPFRKELALSTGAGKSVKRKAKRTTPFRKEFALWTGAGKSVKRKAATRFPPQHCAGGSCASGQEKR